MKIKNVHISIVTDCGRSDALRYEIGAAACFADARFSMGFFETESFNTLHAGFVAGSHAYAPIEYFSDIAPRMQFGILVNAAPGAAEGQKLRGLDNKSDGGQIYALELKNGVCVVGPNVGYNLYFFRDLIARSFLVTVSKNSDTPYRSLEIMLPALAQVMGVRNFPGFTLTPKKLDLPEVQNGIYVGDSDSHGNIYLASIGQEQGFVPRVGEVFTVQIGDKSIKARYTDQFFAARAGEFTLTTGSLTLAGNPVYYLIQMGGSASNFFGNPAVGTKILVQK